MNNYLVKQVKKAIDKNNGKIPEFVDTYNGSPVADICLTITTSTGKWGGVGCLLVIENDK